MTLGNSDSGLQSDFGPGSIRNLGFIRILRRLNFKAAGFITFRKGGSGERFRGKGKFRAERKTAAACPET